MLPSPASLNLIVKLKSFSSVALAEIKWGLAAQATAEANAIAAAVADYDHATFSCAVHFDTSLSPVHGGRHLKFSSPWAGEIGLCCSTAGSHASLTILAQVARGEDVKSLIAEAEETRSTNGNDPPTLKHLIRRGRRGGLRSQTRDGQSAL